MSVEERTKDLRTQKKRTQTDLANRVGLTYFQVGRYETQKANPSSDVLQKTTTTLDTTANYLMNSSFDEVVATQLTDKEVLRQFKKVEQMNNKDKHFVKTFIVAFLTKRQIQKLTH